jgi:tetratricopeptide (TPR) repeat protein
MSAIEPVERTGAGGYSTREVARLMGLTPRRIRHMVYSGFVQPERGKGRAYRFSFQDLVLLRTAKGLLEKGVAAARIRTGLRRLAEQLPPGRPLTAVQIWIRGGEIAVRCGSEAWLPGSGQLLLNFDLAEFAGRVEVLRPAEGPESDFSQTHRADDWYGLGCELESSAPHEAIDAYEQALRKDPGHTDALLNLGRLHHEMRRFPEAEACFARVLRTHPGHATAAYNLGVVLEDVERREESEEAYRLALRLDATLREAHFNLARLLERRGDKSGALRHLQAYRRLTEE